MTKRTFMKWASVEYQLFDFYVTVIEFAVRCTFTPRQAVKLKSPEHIFPDHGFAVNGLLSL